MGLLEEWFLLPSASLRRAFNRFIARCKVMRTLTSNPSTLKIKPGKILSIEPAGEHPVYCLEVDNPNHSFVVDGLVTHNSYDQDPSDFASGDFHFILHDGLPKLAIWQENRARVMRVDGTLMVAMTWPDDPSISVDWIFDELYEKAQPGVDQDPTSLGLTCIQPTIQTYAKMLWRAGQPNGRR